MADSGDRIGPFLLAERVTRARRSSLFHGVRADGLEREPREVLIRVAHEPEDQDVATSLLVEYEVLRAMQGDDRLPRAWGLYAGQGALAIEWVPSVSLRDIMGLAASGKVDLELPTIVDVLIEVAYALRHVHAIVRTEGRLVHGALTPDTVRLCANGRVVVFGFGSREDTLLRAPEAALGVDHDPRSDQWLLGMLALELLRVVPDWAEEPPTTDPAELLARAQGTWPALGRVLATLLSPQPTHRFEPEERMLKELLAVARQLGGSSRRGEVAARTLRLQSPPRPAEPPRQVTMPPPGPAFGRTLPARPGPLPTPPPVAPTSRPVPSFAAWSTLPAGPSLAPVSQPPAAAGPTVVQVDDLAPPEPAPILQTVGSRPGIPSSEVDPFFDEVGQGPPRVPVREPGTPILPDWVVMLAVAFLVAVGGTVLVLHLL